MNTYETHSCGYRLTFPGPASIEDYDAKVGKPGAALEHACLHTIHTRTLPEWQEKFAAVLQERTGIARQIEVRPPKPAKPHLSGSWPNNASRSGATATTRKPSSSNGLRKPPTS
jgi:hypothetical protein